MFWHFVDHSFDFSTQETNGSTSTHPTFTSVLSFFLQNTEQITRFISSAVLNLPALFGAQHNVVDVKNQKNRQTTHHHPPACN